MEGILLLFILLPIGWGLICAAVPLAFAFGLPRSGHPGLVLLAFAWVIGLVAVEFEVMKILRGLGYDGSCYDTMDIMIKVPKLRPCTVSEWRTQQLSWGGYAIWVWRISGAIAHSTFFALLTSRWMRRAKMQAKFKS